MASSPPATSFDEKNRKTVKVFVGVIIVMFLFGFASIPLYRLVCEALDPGGTATPNGTTEEYASVVVDTSRSLKVRMTTNVNRQLPWDFSTSTPSVMVHPGERKMVKFHARNADSQGSVKGKAIYDINPPEAGQYFKKIECFCFQEQELSAGEAVDMPLLFWFDPAMPAEITEVSIAYTFFNMDSSFERTLKARERDESSP